MCEHATPNPAQPARAVRLSALLRPSAPASPAEPDPRAAAAAQARADADAEWARRLADVEAALATEVARAAEAEESGKRLNGELVAALDARFADALATLAYAVARQALAAEPGVSAETLKSLVTEALLALPEGEAGTLHAAPQDLDRLTPPSGWRLLPDPTLAAGSVRAEAGPALARSSLSLRLAALAARQERPQETGL